MTRTTTRRINGLCAAAVLTVMAASCGSSSKSASTNTTSAPPNTTSAPPSAGPGTTGAPASTSAGTTVGVTAAGATTEPPAVTSPQTTASTTAAPATGTPILIGTELPIESSIFSVPEAKAGLEAAIASVNAAGGVNGHPLKLDFCDTKGDANLELSCARQLIADKVVAVVGATISFDQSGAEYPLFEQAGVAYFGGRGSSFKELTSPISYLQASGIPGWFTGSVKTLVKAGSKKFAIYAGNNTAPVKSATALLEGMFKALGIPETTVYADPASDPTLASSAAKVTADGVDGIVLLPENPALMLQALKDAGYTGHKSEVSSTIDAVLSKVGTLADGLLVVSQTAFPTDTSNPAVAEFLKDMQQYASGTAPSLNALSTYADVKLFAEVAKTISSDTIDAAAFRTAADNVSTPIDIGLLGPWAVKGRTAPNPTFPRVLNPNITYGVIKDGKMVSDGGGFVDFTS